MISHLE